MALANSTKTTSKPAQYTVDWNYSTNPDTNYPGSVVLIPGSSQTTRSVRGKKPPLTRIKTSGGNWIGPANEFYTRKIECDVMPWTTRVDRYMDTARSIKHVGYYIPMQLLTTTAPVVAIDSVVEARKRAVLQDLFAEMNKPSVFDGAIQLVELSETVDMLLSGARKCLQLLNNARRKAVYARNAARSGKVLSPKKKPKTKLSLYEGTSLWADAWLLARYGILPLIFSMQEAIEAVMSDPDGFGVAVVSATTSRANTAKENKTVRVHGVDVRCLVVNETKTVVSAKGLCHLGIDPSPLGFSSADFVRAAWEKIPFSFVIDWFIGIGSWLTSHRPTGSRMLNWYVTSLEDATRSVTPIGATNTYAPSDGSWCHGETAVYRSFVMSRSVDQPLPALPAVDYAALQWFRQFDAVALVFKAIGNLLKSAKS